jgi:hypothetical protein
MEKKLNETRKYQKPATKKHEAMNVVQGSYLYYTSLYYSSLYSAGLYYVSLYYRY